MFSILGYRVEFGYHQSYLGATTWICYYKPQFSKCVWICGRPGYSIEFLWFQIRLKKMLKNHDNYYLGLVRVCKECQTENKEVLGKYPDTNKELYYCVRDRS